MTTLPWGYDYAMVRPTGFRVEYRINPFMDPLRQPDPVRALDQWDALVAAIESAGGRVAVLDQRPDSPDMVFAMNLGLAIRGATPGVVMSHMRYPERQAEQESARLWFAEHGLTPTSIGRSGVGPHFEAGDAFPWAGRLAVGFGPRTEQLALKHLATNLDLGVCGVRIVHPGMYHLDLAFCPLDSTHAIVCPAAFDEPSAAALLSLVPEPIIVTEDEAMTFCANSIVIGDRVLMPGCPDRVRGELEAAGFGVEVVDVSEFHLGGGSIRCLTNPLDIALGRDLDPIPGGEVTLPRP